MKDAAEKAERWVGGVVVASQDLLRLVDRDRRSPAYGCFHPPFWLNKTSDHPNARCQEAAYTFALLYANEYPGNSWRGVREIAELARAGLRFWAARQHPDGSSDEWYRGEHGYAATAFTAYALARAYRLLEADSDSRERVALVSAFRRASSWLVRHRDLRKLNHEAVGAAALYALAEATGDETSRAAAREKRDRVLGAQKEEGWFPELGGCDTGYSFITLEYLVRCYLFDPEEKLRLSLLRALGFLRYFIHPDLGTGPEYNLCRNHYVSLLAAAAMGEFSPDARRLFREEVSGPTALRQITQDDLIRCFHLYTGIEAYDAFRASADRFVEDDPPLPFQGASYRRYFPDSRLMSVKTAAYFAVASGDCGGLIKFYALPREGSALRSGRDQGVAVTAPPAGSHLSAEAWAEAENRPTTLPETRLSCCRPDLGSGAQAPAAGSMLYSSLYASDNRVAARDDGALSVSAALRPGKYFFPGRLSRFLLALVSALPGGYLAVKKGMDFIRSRKKATFQISAVSGEGTGWRLERRIAWGEDRITVEDTVAPPPGATAEVALDCDLGRDGLLSARPFAGRVFAGGGTIRKEIIFRDGEITVKL